MSLGCGLEDNDRSDDESDDGDDVHDVDVDNVEHLDVDVDGDANIDHSTGGLVETRGKPKYCNDMPSVEALCKQMNEISFDKEKYQVPPVVTHSLEGLSVQELSDTFDKVYNRWFGEDARPLRSYALAHYVFGLSMKNFYTEEVIDRAYTKIHAELTSLNIAFEHLGVMEDKDPLILNYQKKFNDMYECLYNAKNVLSFTMRMENARDSKRCNSSPEKYDLFRFYPLNTSDLTSLEKLTLYILRKCAERHYRKKGEILYEEHRVRAEDGKDYGTYSWKQVMTIRDFIIQEANPRTNFEMWRNMMDRNTLDKTAKHLAESRDTQLPDLKTDRTVSAWRNGLWFSEFAAFYPYINGRLPNQICATVFIDQEFDNTDYGEHFMEINCVVKQILGDQGFDTEEQSFILGVGFGRLIFEPGKYDRWEIIPFLWGLAQTGKSCIIDACARLFDSRDVAGVGNSIEKQFGLAPLIGKNLWVANDVKKNFGMDAGDIQTITSLELMSVAVKFKEAISVKWEVPGIIAGNEIPRSWTDTLKSLERRIFLIEFPNAVKRDNAIKVRLETERSVFYRIITYAYHYWQRKCGNKNIWDYAPKRFRDAKKIIQEHENPLEIFLNTITEVQITKNDKDYVRPGHFNNWFKNWCSNWGHKAKPLSPTELKQVLRTRGVKTKYCEREWPLNQTPTTQVTGDEKRDPVDLIASKPLMATDEFYFGIRLISKKTAGAHGAHGAHGNGNGGRLPQFAPGISKR
jgi:hypothetical protein